MYKNSKKQKASVVTIDKKFALIGKDIDVMFPQMKSDKRRNLFGFALSEQEKRDALAIASFCHIQRLKGVSKLVAIHSNIKITGKS